MIPTNWKLAIAYAALAWISIEFIPWAKLPIDNIILRRGVELVLTCVIIGGLAVITWKPLSNYLDSINKPQEPLYINKTQTSESNAILNPYSTVLEFGITSGEAPVYIQIKTNQLWDSKLVKAWFDVPKQTTSTNNSVPVNVTRIGFVEIGTPPEILNKPPFFH